MTPTKLRAMHRGDEDYSPEERILRDVYGGFGVPQIMVIATDLIAPGWLLCTKRDEVVFMGRRGDLYAFLKGEMGRFDTMMVSAADLKDLEKTVKSMAARIVKADKGKVQ